MNVFSKIAKGIKNAIIPAKSVDMQSQELLDWLGISSTPKRLVSEVTYFTCLKMLSETLGKMLLFIKCNRHVPDKNRAIRAAVMSFHCKLMLFVSDVQIFCLLWFFCKNLSCLLFLT